MNSGGALTTKAEIDITSNAADVNNVVVKNNIAQATRANTYAIYLDSNTYNSSGLNITNNIYYASEANWYYWNSSGGNNLTTWNGFTGIGTDLNSDPYLVAGGDAKPYPYFYPRSYSPVINAGVDVGLTSDYLGTLVPQAAAPDIGAFEYTVSIPENIWFFFPLFLALPRLIFLLSNSRDRKLFLDLLRKRRYQAILRELYLPYLNLVSSLTKRSN